MHQLDNRELVEFRVKAQTRYTITRHFESCVEPGPGHAPKKSTTVTVGEFADVSVAKAVGHALAMDARRESPSSKRKVIFDGTDYGDPAVDASINRASPERLPSRFQLGDEARFRNSQSPPVKVKGVEFVEGGVHYLVAAGGDTCLRVDSFELDPCPPQLMTAVELPLQYIIAAVHTFAPENIVHFADTAQEAEVTKAELEAKHCLEFAIFSRPRERRVSE